jgi:predicted nucleic acid-binding protein
MIVADTGPIIAFARLGRLGLLSDVVGVLIIPDAIYEELVGRGQERPGAAEVAQGTWIHRRTLTDSASIAQLPPALHRGEREAILLAEELKAQLLIDEQRGRETATARGLAVLGSLRILGEAKRRGFITAVRPLIEELLAIGYWIYNERVIQVFLQEMGELPPYQNRCRSAVSPATLPRLSKSAFSR